MFNCCVLFSDKSKEVETLTENMKALNLDQDQDQTLDQSPVSDTGIILCFRFPILVSLNLDVFGFGYELAFLNIFY